MIQHSFTSGGFPLTVEHLQSIEQQVEHLAAFAKLFFNATGDTKVYVPSDFFTISDGQFAANTAGYVMWKGEMLFVEAATYSQAAQTIYFAIDTALENKVYADNATNPYRTMRTGRFTVAQPASPADIADSFSTADINSHLVTAIASLARNTVGSPTKPVYINNGVPTAGTYELKKTVDTNAELTDTKVTAVGNHYAPAEDSSAQLSASASGATAAWNIDVVKGVTLKRDAKGHVTGVAVTSGKIPANPDTGATSVEVTGSGNAVTGASYSASTRKLSLTKGTTFLTSHQDISGKAPNNHRSTATTYGAATSSYYGHVKLGAANQNGATAADGVAAPNGHTHSQYLTSHQSLAAYTPTANMPSIGILQIVNYGSSITCTYIHLLGPANSLSNWNHSADANFFRMQFALSKRYMLLAAGHGAPSGTPYKTIEQNGYGGNIDSLSATATKDSTWAAGYYAGIYVSGHSFHTVLVIGY